ncbi:MAG: type II toxin-antitoxin system CcdA family antitoxin [Methanobrevibacter sp.]|uniref:type II toxin-antitoxin system CcdA family antitoxin n=1 Tax=Methanobrevibacter sp. TaxID=66852 RepID=UPI0025FA8784|nr:type II toxin-antitoxin system CcdA family antitoxin [uncultured Methanobrevibacter sp.]MEE1129117.1 type II toxin-antitoxin system CcdA family antitoxin [Methanobrevibacter sp.]
MSKKRLELTIEKDILEKAKKHIPNLSGFVEECLKHYFGYADGIFPIGNVNEITDKIGRLQVELFLINQNYDAEESRKNAENEERDKAWRFLWNDFKPSLIPDETLLEKAIEVLGINGEELEDILDWVYITDVKVDTNSWQEVLKAYNENKDE